MRDVERGEPTEEELSRYGKQVYEQTLKTGNHLKETVVETSKENAESKLEVENLRKHLIEMTQRHKKRKQEESAKIRSLELKVKE